MEIAIPDTIEAYKTLTKEEKKAVFTKIWEEGRQDEVMGRWNMPKGPFTTMAVRLGVTEGNPVTKQRREKAKAKKAAQAKQIDSNDSAPDAAAVAPAAAEQAPAPKKTRRTPAKSGGKSVKAESKEQPKIETSSKAKPKRTTAKKAAQKPVVQPDPELAVSSAPPEVPPQNSAVSVDESTERISISVAEFAEMQGQIKKLSAVVDVLFDKINDLEKRQWK